MDSWGCASHRAALPVVPHKRTKATPSERGSESRDSEIERADQVRSAGFGRLLLLLLVGSVHQTTGRRRRGNGASAKTSGAGAEIGGDKNRALELSASAAAIVAPSICRSGN